MLAAETPPPTTRLSSEHLDGFHAGRFTGAILPIGRDRADLPYHVESLDNLAERGVLPVKVLAMLAAQADEELAAGGIRV